MAWLLRQSTASQEIPIGPLVDATDGVTPETGLTIANTDIKLWKAGATASVNKNSGGATHSAAGTYSAVLDATDTDTLGSGRIIVQASGALAWWMDVTVLPAAVYDALVAGTGAGLRADLISIAGATVATGSAQLGVNLVNVAGSAVSAASGLLNANVTQISGDATAADNLESYCDGTTPIPSNLTQIAGTAHASTAIRANVVQYGGSAGTFASGRPEVNTTHVGGSAVSATGGLLNANVTQISGDSTAADNLEAALDGTGFEEIRRGTAQAGGATTITLDTGASATNDYYNGVLVRLLSGTGAGQVRQITDYVGATKVATVGAAWATNPASDSVFVLESFAEIAGASAPTAAAIRAEIDANSTQLAAIIADTNDIQTRLPAALVGGRIDANVGAISGDSVAADNLEAAADGTGYNLGGGSVVAASVTGAVGSVTGNVGGNVQGNVAGSVGSVTGAVGSVTGNVGGNVAGSVASVTGNVGGNVVGSVGSVATGGLTAASVAADAGAEIATAVRTELTTELGRLDAAVSTRQATLGATQYEAAADALLNRNAQGGSNTGVLVRHKLAGVPNRIVIARTTSTTGTMTIYAEDGTTVIDTLSLTFVADTGAIASVTP